MDSPIERMGPVLYISLTADRAAASVSPSVNWSGLVQPTFIPWPVASPGFRSRGGGHVPQCPIAGDATARGVSDANCNKNLVVYNDV